MFARVGVLLLCAASLQSCGGDPVTTTLAIGGAGLTTSKLLDKMSDKVQVAIGQAASSGSLAADAAARNLMLVLENERVALDDDLDKRWDRLDREKLDLLKALDAAVDRADELGGKVQDIQELTFLDAGSLIDKLPFTSKTYALTRVDGATQTFKQAGTYQFKIRGNPFILDGRSVSVYINGKPLRQNAITSQHTFDIDVLVPAAMLATAFDDRKLGVTTLKVAVDVPVKAPWYKPWQHDGVKQLAYNVPIRLLPRFPLEYSFEEYTSNKIVNPSTVQWQPSRQVIVNGCGDSGCYAMWNVYADLPPGTEATGKVRNCTDTQSGYGMFARQDGFLKLPFLPPNMVPSYVQACGPGTAEADAIQAQGSSVMMQYQQHSHVWTRTVQFEAGYHPLKDQQSVRQIVLAPLTLDTNAPATTPASAPAGGGSSVKDVLDQLGLAGSFSMLVDAAKLRTIFGGTGPIETTAPVKASPPSAPPVQKGYLQYGQSYEAQLTPGAKGWTLRVKNFLGDDIIVTERKTDPRVDAVSTDETSFSRVVVTPKAPF